MLQNDTENSSESKNENGEDDEETIVDFYDKNETRDNYNKMAFIIMLIININNMIFTLMAIMMLKMMALKLMSYKTGNKFQIFTVSEVF